MGGFYTPYNPRTLRPRGGLAETPTNTPPTNPLRTLDEALGGGTTGESLGGKMPTAAITIQTPESIAEAKAQEFADQTRINRAKLGQPPLGGPITPPTVAATDTTTDQTQSLDDLVPRGQASVENHGWMKRGEGPFRLGVLGEGSTHPEVRPGTPEAMQSLWWNQFLDKREGEKRADEMANLALEQERTKTSMLPASLQSEIGLKGAQAGLAGAQGGLFGAQAKKLSRTPEEEAYAGSQLPIRKWIIDHFDDPGVGDSINARALQKAQEFQRANPKISPARLKAMEGQFFQEAMNEYIVENDPRLQSKAVGVMGSPLGTNLFNNPYGL